MSAAPNRDSVSAIAAVNITIENTQEHQQIEGFGASQLSLTYEEGLGDVLGPSLRNQAIDAACNQVGLKLGNLGSFAGKPWQL